MPFLAIYQISELGCSHSGKLAITALVYFSTEIPFRKEQVHTLGQLPPLPQLMAFHTLLS